MISVTVTLLVVGLILTGQAKTAAQILSSHTVRAYLARDRHNETSSNRTCQFERVIKNENFSDVRNQLQL